MLRADNFGQGACYTDVPTRKGVVLNMLGNCYTIFSETSLIKRLDDFTTIFTAADFNCLNLEKLNKIVCSLDPQVLDAVRICICFENFFKAQLLLKGYIMHKIDGKELASEYRHLSNEQRTRPILISEIKAAEGLRWKRKNDYSFRSLSNSTIEFSKFLKQPQYQTKIRMPKELFVALESINQKRNTLHYLVSDLSKYNQKFIDELILIKRCFNGFLVSKQNQLVRELNFPDIHLKKPL